MLEELSGFYLKVGQFLASKADVLPEPIISELSILFENIKPDPPRIVHKTLKRELGGLNISRKKCTKVEIHPSTHLSGNFLQEKTTFLRN